MNTPLRGGGASNTAARRPAVTPPNPLQNPHIDDENTPPNSLQNPYLVDENGRFIHNLRRTPSFPFRSPSGRVLLIYGGPPSSIVTPPSMVMRSYPKSRATRDAANVAPYQQPAARAPASAPPPTPAPAAAQCEDSQPARPPPAPALATHRPRGLVGTDQSPVARRIPHVQQTSLPSTLNTNAASAITSSLTLLFPGAAMNIVISAFADGSNRAGSAPVAAP
ncbi:hypothetical protein B0H13DRAFT_2387664 [Mycena leptocephala]|nr:hypothetical protein B0H13DRAFT_2387664 [Mycena leptocephala]